ncbi:MAG: phosphodiesterase [Erysipelotrichaceae bacterium]|nr:phosphodiesterase [Erysipelotrichaceae bacterium]
MKIFIASDIHGDALCCQKMLERFREEKADRILLLGDILYHGPRNDLPSGYEPKKVIALLNEYSDIIFAVKGNCDGEVDQMVLNFPLLNEYIPFYIDGISFIATHGHIYNADKPIAKAEKIYLCGHTHIPAREDHNGIMYLNPGSIALPKNDTRYSYMVYEDRRFIWKDLNTKEEYMEYRL